MKTIIYLTFFFFFVALQNITAQCYPDRHSRVSTDGWESCTASLNPNPVRTVSHWIMYDLGSTRLLGTSTFWNFNDPKNLDKGVREVAIDYSINGDEWTDLGVHIFPQADGSSIYEGYQGLDFEGIAARYILITPLTNWGHTSCFGFSEMRVSTNESALPVNILAFKGDCDGGKINMQWEVVDELAIKKYRIEESVDGLNWNHTIDVAATAKSYYEANIKSNHFIDKLYRLISLDNDGLETMHQSIAINCEIEGISAFPNPFSDYLDLQWESEIEISEWELMDVMGRKVLSNHTTHQPSQQSINTTNLVDGTYLLNLKNESNAYQLKLVKHSR